MNSIQRGDATASLGFVGLLALTCAACDAGKPDAHWAPGANDAATEAHGLAKPQGATPAPPSSTPQVAPAPQREIGRVVGVQGAPVLLRGEAPFGLAPGTPLGAGDRITTNDEAKIRIELNGASVLAIGPRSSVSLERLDVTPTSRSGVVRVIAGQFWMQVAKLAGGRTNLEVAMPNAVAGIRGTTLWGDVGRDVVCALEGSIQVRVAASMAKPTLLKAGNCSAELSKGKGKRLRPTPAQVEQYLGEVHIAQPPASK